MLHLWNCFICMTLKCHCSHKIAVTLWEQQFWLFIQNTMFYGCFSFWCLLQQISILCAGCWGVLPSWSGIDCGQCYRLFCRLVPTMFKHQPEKMDFIRSVQTKLFNWAAEENTRSTAERVWSQRQTPSAGTLTQTICSSHTVKSS